MLLQRESANYYFTTLLPIITSATCVSVSPFTALNIISMLCHSISILLPTPSSPLLRTSNTNHRVCRLRTFFSIMVLRRKRLFGYDVFLVEHRRGYDKHLVDSVVLVSTCLLRQQNMEGATATLLLYCLKDKPLDQAVTSSQSIHSRQPTHCKL